MMTQDAILPMRFGLIARDEESLRDELIEDTDMHLAILAEVDGGIEINVKVLWRTR